MKAPWWQFHRKANASRSNPSSSDPGISLLLDIFHQEDIQKWSSAQKRFIEYHWELYTCLALQRARILEDLKLALSRKCKGLKFEHWNRIVDYRFALDPLSAIGSIKTIQGGRFNIGSLDETRFPKFPALYIAEDYEIAFREKFGLSPAESNQGLAPDDLALASGKPLTSISVKGFIEQVLDIRDRDALSKFVKLISEFKIPRRVKSMGSSIGIKQSLIKDVDFLQKVLMEPLWKAYPMHVDIPSNSQIFGQIAHSAGIEAIQYKSIVGNNQSCLAIFPENFQNSSSFLELEGDCPSEVRNRRLDSSTWESFVNFIN